MEEARVAEGLPEGERDDVQKEDKKEEKNRGDDHKAGGG